MGELIFCKATSKVTQTMKSDETVINDEILDFNRFTPSGL